MNRGRGEGNASATSSACRSPRMPHSDTTKGPREGLLARPASYECRSSVGDPGAATGVGCEPADDGGLSADRDDQCLVRGGKLVIRFWDR